MKVHELVEKLSHCSGDMEVVMPDFISVKLVSVHDYGNGVVILSDICEDEEE